MSLTDEQIEQLKYWESNRQLARDEVGDIVVSTILLPFDHSFGEGPPQFYETMVRRGGEWTDQWRYATKEEALRGHFAVVSWIKGEREEVP
jgi:hypothetical protein